MHGADETGNAAPTARPDNNDYDAVIEAGVDFIGLPVPGDPTASGNVILGTFGLGVDTDPDGDTLQVTALSVGGLAAQVGVPVVLTYGALVINADGSWTYTLDNSDPDTNALRQTQAVFNEPAFEQLVTYTVSDGHGGTDSAALTIRVSGTNDAPILGADVNSVTEGDGPTSVSGNVLANDHDPEGSSLQVLGPPPGTPFQGTYGTLTINSDGSYVYTTNPALVNFLDAGEVAHDIFAGRYAVSEVFDPLSPGPTTTAFATLLDITIHGVDEAPSFALGTVFEDGPRSASGDLGDVVAGQVTGAGPMTPWADYRFRIDNLSITRSGTHVLQRHFGDGSIAPGGAELRLPHLGHVHRDQRPRQHGRVVRGSGGPGFAGHSATLNTNTARRIRSRG